MKDKEAFENWLEEGGSKSSRSRATRIYALQTIGRKLKEVGMPFPNLEAAWKADCFESLLERLKRMEQNARDGGQDYRLLMPDSENPHKRPTSVLSHKQLYFSVRHAACGKARPAGNGASHCQGADRALHRRGRLALK